MGFDEERGGCLLTAGLTAIRPFLGVVSVFDSQICLPLWPAHRAMLGSTDKFTDRQADSQTEEGQVFRLALVVFTQLS